jgi:tRNA (adenine22-N1)-methyltransferase
LLSKRLSAVLALIDPEDRIADIGCDHGYLIRAALDKGVKFAQGIDNKEGPLESARGNLSSYLGPNVILTLGSGLDRVDARADTALFCGMGGMLIIDLLTRNITKAKTLKKLILEANNKIDECRSFLDQNGFTITHEIMVEDRNQFYEIMVVRFTGNNPFLDEDDCRFGPLLRRRQTEVFVRKWNRILKAYEDAYRSLENAAEVNIGELKKKITSIRRVLGEKAYESTGTE